MNFSNEFSLLKISAILFLFVFIYSDYCWAGESGMLQKKKPKECDRQFQLLERLRNEIDVMLYSFPPGAKDIHSQVSFFAKQEKLMMQYRYQGLTLWNKFPTDRRRYIWLEKTMEDYDGNHILYWKNIDSGSLVYINVQRGSNPNRSYKCDVDKKKLDEWRIIYPKMRLEYANFSRTFPEVANKYSHLLYNEMIGYLKLSANINLRDDPETLIENAKALFLNAVYCEDSLTSPSDYILNNPYNMACYRMFSVYFFGAYRTLLGLNSGHLKAFLSSFGDVHDARIQEFLKKWGRTFNLYDMPIELEGITMNGKKIDLNEFRGQVVFLDFWVVNCHGCVARMPYYRNLYNKYKDQGFAFLSICGDDWVNRPEKIQQIKKIETNVNAHWPTIIRDDKADAKTFSKAFLDDHAYWGFPRLLLLDRSGKLILYNNDLLYEGDCEDIIRKALQGVDHTNL